jgi:hypothetical protein
MVNDLQIVGIHIRRGDYVSKKNIKYGYQTATPEYMNKSMNYFREKFQKEICHILTEISSIITPIPPNIFVIYCQTISQPRCPPTK